MTTSLNTFESTLRNRLLDVISSQWYSLGVPFNDVRNSPEVVDPEALLWSSLEFLPTEPRLREGVESWVQTHRSTIIQQRFKKWAKSDSERATLLRDLKKTTRAHAGDPVAGPSTLLLRSRDLLGSDTRHFLLVYLLSNPTGGRLRNLQEWIGYSYQGVLDVATRWQSAGAASIDHGYCRLTDPRPWRALLKLGDQKIVLVNFFNAFEACIRLLRALEKARNKGLAWASPVVAAHRREAYQGIWSSLLSEAREEAQSINSLCELFPIEDRAAA